MEQDRFEAKFLEKHVDHIPRMSFVEHIWYNQNAAEVAEILLRNFQIVPNALAYQLGEIVKTVMEAVELIEGEFGLIVVHRVIFAIVQ